MVELLKAQRLAEAGDHDEAWQLVDAALREKPNDLHAMVLTSFILEKTGKQTLAYHVIKRATEMYPKEPIVWLNLGRVCDTLWLVRESEACYRRALKLNNDHIRRATILNNMAGLLIQNGRFAEALPMARESLQIEPQSRKAAHNVGLSLMAKGEWTEGWKHYEASLGSDHRAKFRYADEADWDGSAGKRVVVYGEQGLGDEINMASVIPDAVERAEKVIIDCDPRLVNLYKRSFPKASVYGTRGKMELDWDEADQKIDASCSTMQLAALFRPAPASCPATPYLKADPDRVRMWRSLWATKGKPVIGVSWTGGVEQTAARYRRWTLDDLLPVFRSVDAHWVCLQYKDAQKEIDAFRAKHPDIDLKQYPHATLTRDYDDTAGITASLDAVVAMQSTIIHLCGALGVPCAVGLPHTSQWRYGEAGDTMPWYGSVRLFRKKAGDDWTDAIARIAKWTQSEVGMKEAA